MTLTRLKNIAQLIFLVVVLVIIAVYLRDQWRIIQAEDLTFNWPLLGLAQAVMMLGWILLPLGPYLILRYLGRPLAASAVWPIAYIANAAKYLPGGIWALPGQVFFFQRAGIPTGQSVIAVFWETVTKLLGAAVVALLGIGLVLVYLPAWVVFGGLGLVFLLVAGGYGLLVVSPGFRARLLRLPAVITRPFTDESLTRHQFLSLLGLYSIIFGLFGASFVLMTVAIVPEFEFGWTLSLVGLYSGGWILGFLIFLSPGGIGIRDGIIILGMTVFLAVPYPAVVAIGMRISWSLAEATVLVIGLIIERWMRPKVAQA
jgi:glycosyltransferase 2 family protein